MQQILEYLINRAREFPSDEVLRDTLRRYIDADICMREHERIDKITTNMAALITPAIVAVAQSGALNTLIQSEFLNKTNLSDVISQLLGERPILETFIGLSKQSAFYDILRSILLSPQTKSHQLIPAAKMKEPGAIKGANIETKVSNNNNNNNNVDFPDSSPYFMVAREIMDAQSFAQTWRVPISKTPGTIIYPDPLNSNILAFSIEDYLIVRVCVPLEIVRVNLPIPSHVKRVRIDLVARLLIESGDMEDLSAFRHRERQCYLAGFPRSPLNFSQAIFKKDFKTSKLHVKFLPVGETLLQSCCIDIEAETSLCIHFEK